MKKRVCAIGLALALLLSCFGAASAADTELQPRASEHLATYVYGMTTGDQAGEVVVVYTISGLKTLAKIGLTKLVIYNSSGTVQKTVYGSASNGLLVSNDDVASGEYIYQGVSGQRYYAVLTIYGSDGTSYTSRVVTTNTVTAP